MLRAGAKRIQELGVRPELEIFDTGHLWFANKLRRRGPDRRPADVPAVHGHPVRRPARARPCWPRWWRRSRRAWCGPRSPSGACRCRGWRSRCCSAATCGSAWRTTSTSAGATRSPTRQLVANAVTIITAMGAEVATPDEAREILALRPRRDDTATRSRPDRVRTVACVGRRGHRRRLGGVLPGPRVRRARLGPGAGRRGAAARPRRRRVARAHRAGAGARARAWTT